MEQFLEIITLPDNVPIVGMLFLLAFFIWYALAQARANDRVIAELEANPEMARRHHRKRYPWHKDWEQRVHVWPYLLRIEYLGAIVVFIILLVWSITLNAPLEEPASGALTPNPSKAPWYFLGLQEMLVYFDPWIAGVFFPSLIVVGLMAVPYIDVNPKGNGYYTWKQRKLAISIFLFGFLALWIGTIIVGTFLRGPGWQIFLPGTYWDPHKVVAETNINFHEFFGIQNGTTAAYVFGGIFVGLYFAAGYAALRFFFKRYINATYERMGPARFATFAIFFLMMFSFPLKIIARMAFNVKYVWTTPFFNV